MKLFVTMRVCLLLRRLGRGEGAELRCDLCEFSFGRVSLEVGDEEYVMSLGKRVGRPFGIFRWYSY